jgi:Tfp pilus assembly protein PilW
MNLLKFQRKQIGATSFVSESGFSLVELIMSLVLSLLILGVAVATFSGALGSRDRESSRTDALTSAQAALNVMSREIGNSGYGLNDNGIVLADSNTNQIRVRANIDNVGGNGANTSQKDEDIVYYCETCNGSTTGSVVRSDRNISPDSPSGIINRVSDVDFAYFDADPATCLLSTTALTAPTINTAKVRITLIVILPEARGQALNQKQRLTSDVTLRNSPCMLRQY